MSKFEQSRPDHEVHELHRPMGHGYMDQKHQKGGRSPITGSVPTIGSGTVPGANGASSPGVPMGQYGQTDQTGDSGGVMPGQGYAG